MSIGVFDSGFGGLTVLRALMRKLPEESFIYLGDSARLPYGTKSESTIRAYLNQNIEFLLDHDVDAIVVACNSASSVLSETEIAGRPIYGVIEPGALRAVQLSPSGHIGVAGTKATVNGQSYVKAIHRINAEAKVYQQACPLLVPLVEEGLEDDPLSNLIVYRYISPLLQTSIDTLILGCTHYPVLAKSFRKVLGPEVQLIDSAEAISEIVEKDILGGRIQSKKYEEPELKIYATDVAESFLEVAQRILAPLTCPKIEAVHL